ncbi:HDOD domain-containing protein [uncultured Gimesia sp.]|uniref:HDOD domain-containing protein n=1 Tax=uncultured Gimesia sp. TaxID=1678688 RepID=UPI0030D6D4AE|tara:strand:+ start:24440 stop:25333 length:894 start_codon:yes stop_codon:yes gene_type:complete
MIQTETKIDNANEFPPIVELSFHKIKNIATLPAVAHQIMNLVADAESTTDDLRKVIINDPALSACILKVVNSSYYGFPQQIGSIDRAIVLLGLNAIKNIAIATSLNKVFKSNRIGTDFDPCDLWTHSVAVAICARELSVMSGLGDPDEVFLAGLIHDIGIMVEMQANHQEFVEIIGIVSREQDTTFRQAEEQVLGATHELFGAYTCREWNFPPHFEHVVRYHHHPLQLPETDRIIPVLVHVADILAANIHEGYSRTVETETIDPEMLSILNLRESDVESLGESLRESIHEAHQLLGG